MKSNCYPRFLMDAACRFKRHAKVAGQLGDEQAIHDFRVAVKEIDAFQKPLNTLASPEQQKMLMHWRNRLQKIYKPAGKFRNGLIIQKLGRRAGVWDLLPEAEVYLLVKNESRLSDFLSVAQSYHFPQLVKVKSFLQSVLNQMDVVINQTIQNNYTQALPLLTQPSGIHWHEARGALKNNYFLLLAQDQCSRCMLNRESVILTGIIEKELGNWHDWLMLQQYVVNYEGLNSPQKGSALSCIQYYLTEVEEQIMSRVVLLRGMM